MTDEVDLAKLSWTDVARRLEGGCAAILPVGSTEAHGPHLPLDTDVTIATGMARRAARRLTERSRPCVVLPAVGYAVTDFAGAFPGSLSIGVDTAVAHVADVLVAAVRTGFAPVALANGHLEPAHIGSLKAAVDRVRERTGAEIVFPDVTRRRLAERLTEEFRSGACHAGRYESSLVMADDPSSVHDEQRRELEPVDISLVEVIRAGITDFVEAGGSLAYFGAPADATAEEGRATFETLATFLVEGIEAADPGGRP